MVFLICNTMWGFFKYRNEIFEVGSAGMVHGQQVVERATTNSFDKMGDAGEKGFKGARRMVGKAYQNHQQNKRGCKIPIFARFRCLPGSLEAATSF